MPLTPPTYVDSVPDPEPLTILVVLIGRWKEIVLITAVFLLLGMAASFLIVRPSYTSVAVFLPPPGFQTSQPMGSGLCTAMLGSRSLNEHVVQKLQLQTAWKRRTIADAREALKNEVQIEASNDGIVRITVRDHNASLASAIANEYLNELNALNTRLAESDAAYRHNFLARQAKQENSELRQAENRLQEVQQRSSLINSDRQTMQAITSVSQLHEAIAARSVELQSMRSYASDTNPSVLQSRATIAELERQLSNLQNSSSSRAAGDIGIPTGEVANLALQNQRALREVKLHRDQSSQVMLQLAQARMNLARTAPVAPVIDLAIVADYKSGPQRVLFWLTSCCAGFFAACFYVFLGEAMMLSGYTLASIRGLLRPRLQSG